MHKFAKVNLPDAVYNWIKDFFKVEPTARDFREKSRNLPTLLASVVQGSGLGPAACRQRGRPIRPIHPGKLIKFADDTYLVIAADNNRTCEEELKQVQEWAR